MCCRMRQICPGLFCGDTRDASNVEALVQKRITLVVVAAKDHPCCFEGHFQYEYYPIVDDETDNVLLHVDHACDAIHACIESRGNALVHCAQGVSRSVAIVTGFIMKERQLDFSAAYDIVRLAYPHANIADNFAEQLEAYGSMYYWNMNLNTQAHRLYRTRHRISRNNESEVEMVAEYRFTCLKCRESLFLDTQCVNDASNNYRVECMRWMESQVDSGTEGPLMCPRCGSKVGQFNWSGLAGDYGIPGFIITSSKVDRMPVTCGFKGEAFPKTRF